MVIKTIQGTIERLFGISIRPQERRLVTVLTLDLLLMLTVYYILKVVREPLIMLEGGAVSRNAARGVQALVLLVMVPVYGLVANRVHPRRLVTVVLSLFLLSLLAFPLLVQLGLPTGFTFFVWLGIFSITVVAQFWSLANDLYSEEAGKRLFPVIASGATVGAVLGSQVVVLTNSLLGPTGLILLAAALLGICVFLTSLARRIAEGPGRAAAVGAAEEAPYAPAPPHLQDHRGGFRLLLHNRYLLLIAVSVLVLNLVNTTGDQVMAMMVQEHAAGLSSKAARSEYMMSFYGSFQTWVSILTALFQVFVVGRLLKATGVRGAVLVLPLLAFTGYGLLAAAPALMLVRALKIFENSTEYSLQNTVQQVLFLPTSRATKYKGKAATDTFFVRFGDLASWALVALALGAGWSSRAMSLVNVGAAAVWLVMASLVARRYRKLAADAEPAPAAVVRALGSTEARDGERMASAPAAARRGTAAPLEAPAE
jgi:ATP:ADP antiporter, AAA family